MAKLDQGYRKARAASSSSTGSRSRRVSMSTFLRENPKDRIADLYIRSAKKGILDVLGLHENSDMAMSIEKQLREDLKGDKKAELANGYATAANKNTRDAVGRMAQIEENKRTVEAQALLDALYSATSMREREPISMMAISSTMRLISWLTARAGARNQRDGWKLGSTST